MKCYDCNKELTPFELTFTNSFKKFNKQGIKIVFCQECDNKRIEASIRKQFKDKGIEV